MLAAHAFERWLEAHPPPTAIYCQNDAVAFGVLDVLKARGIRPGQDVSVVGYDNHEQYMPEHTPHRGLTTVDHDVQRLARRCVERLLEQMVHNHRQVMHERIAAHLLVRASTGPAA